MEWDKVRREVLAKALRELVKVMEQETRVRMGAEARAAVLESVADRLWGYASQAPLQVRGQGGSGWGSEPDRWDV